MTEITNLPIDLTSPRASALDYPSRYRGRTRPDKHDWKFAERSLQLVNNCFRGAVRFLQIGGNDGQLADPVFQFIKCYKWSGLIVEPVPDYFAQLIETYAGNTNIACRNCAVDTVRGSRAIYVADEKVIGEQLKHGIMPWFKASLHSIRNISSIMGWNPDSFIR